MAARHTHIMRTLFSPAKLAGIATCFFCSSLLAQTAAPAAKTITLAADEWCPYNCAEEDKAKPGYMIEIAQTVLSKVGYTVEYKTMAFQRAMQEVLNDTLTGVICVDTPTLAEAEALYQKTNSKPAGFIQTVAMGMPSVSIFTSSTSTWTFDPANPEASLKALGGKVGIPQGYSFDLSPTLQKMGLLVEISSDAPLQQLLKMLEGGRLAAIMDDSAVIQYEAAQIGLGNKIRFAGNTEDPLACTIGFNTKDKDYVDLLNKGIAELRASGELTKILQRYNIKDWN
ncbi:MAG: ABC transporter substrate-binding protein [Pseudomonadales bacterium]